MQLTALFLLTAGLTTSAAGFSQKVTLSERDAPMAKVIQEIQRQTGYEFLYSEEQLKVATPVTVNLKDVDLPEALSACFKGQPLTFAIIEKTVVVKHKEVLSIRTTDTTAPRQVNVSGKVTNAEGEVLAGASVEMKNGKKSTITDSKGGFELKNVPEGTVLVVSYTGYQNKEIEVKQADLSIVLAIANNQLDQAQVIAYGTATERLNTGNVTTVNAKEIEEQPVTNPLLALEGRVPGLLIVQGSGMPGSSVSVNIQGQNSILNGNSPFFVVDGVPYSSTVQQGLSTAGGNPLDFINPSDIESISVLKDADATAIYGSRAANGAILITTKKGKIGQTKFGINFNNGWSRIARYLPVLNTPEYLEMRHEAINNDGLTVQSTDYDLNGTWDTTRNIDWQKSLLANSAQYSNLDADISGGNQLTQYFIGATYNRQSPPFPGKFLDQKGSIHLNITTASADKRFKLQLNGSYLIDNNQLPGLDLTRSAYLLAPDNPPLLNKDGSLNFALASNGYSTLANNGTNPLAFTLEKYFNENNNLVSNAVLSYMVITGLEIKSNFGYARQEVNETYTTPLTFYQPAYYPYVSRTASYQYNNSNSWIIEPQVEYSKVLGKFKLQALLGSTINQNHTNSLQLHGSEYSSDLLLQDPEAAGTITVSGTTQSIYKYAAAFSRISLNWDDKYLLNLTGRRDGSSRFGAANEYHNFAAVGAGWVFSKETTIQDNLSFLSFGKLKASYGTTGSDQIGDYSFLSLYNPPGSLPYEGIAPLTPGGLTNPYLQWEETRKLEFGIDLGFLKDRLLLNGTYVKNRSSNELLLYSLPSITGFTSIEKNFPATVQNTAGEFTLSTINIKVKHFRWTSHINLTIPTNKLVSFPGLATSSYASFLIVGKPITGLNKVYHFLGVNDTTGVYQFADAKGNPTYNPQYGTDNTAIISAAPKYYGGFQNTFNYKGFELDVFFNFVKQIGVNYKFGNYPGNINQQNQPTYVLDRWQKPGDHASIQRFSTSYSSYYVQWQDANVSDAGYTNASFIRLKNLAVSYQLPRVSKSRAGLYDFKVYLQAQNLLTITSYKGMDPELPSGSSAGLPPLRVVTVGIKGTF